MEKHKSLDALDMVRQIRDAHYEQTKTMTKTERLAFYREQGQKAQRELEHLAKTLTKSRP